MKKFYTIIILFLLIFTSFSVSSTILTKTEDYNIEKHNDPQQDYNNILINFFEEGFKDYINDENDFIKKTYMVPMRDGVSLATDVYLPIIFHKPHGTIFLQTPYGKDDLFQLGVILALIGWPTVIQDIRGTHDSEGIFQGYRECQTDGPDSLSWIASRDWSNGKVATVGPSALGIAQYFMAGANPPELACQGVMVATPNLHKHAVYQGGEFRKNLVEEWLKGINAYYLLQEIIDNENYTEETWINVTLDDNWQDVNVPAIHMGGWYDIFLQGTIDAYYGYQHLGGSGAEGKSKLVIGPWWHGGFIGYKQGELTYPENSRKIIELLRMFSEMVSKYTMNENTSFDERPSVWYYTMGDVDVIDAPGNQWNYADDWPVPADNISWYFNDNGSLSKNLPGTNEPITYVYDPTNPVPTIGGQNLDLPAGPFDQTSIEGRDDILVFTSDILTEPYKATGPIKARLFVSSDCPDTDFTVKLTDVYPDGRSMLICDGILRMRNRNGTDHWEFMQQGEIYEIEVDMWSTSYIWNTGHKIRVAVSSSNYPRFLANPNTQDSVYKNQTYNIANNTLFIDSEHPSCIILPEIKKGITNNPPSKPKKPSGLRKINNNLSFKYTSSTVDPDNDNVYLLFDWGDGNSSGWLGPYPSGEKISAYHIWKDNGTFEIRVKAKDVNDTLSQWSDSLSVITPKIARVKNPIILRILKIFPCLKPLFYQFL